MFIVYYNVYHILGIFALNNLLVHCNSYNDPLDRLLFLLLFFRKIFRVELYIFFCFCVYWMKYVYIVDLSIIRIFSLYDLQI